ncbi:hypothetical protein [Lactiplantibacillus plantarum]|nr:hypothetical protein [Lactiplantibacillus plantarum]
MSGTIVDGGLKSSDLAGSSTVQLGVSGAAIKRFSGVFWRSPG